MQHISEPVRALVARAQMPRPRKRFDFNTALIAYQDDRTDAARAKYPELSAIWDELDELRAERFESISADDYQEQEDRADKWETIADECAFRLEQYDPDADNELTAIIETLRGIEQ